jgi:hypothetical protein
MTALREPTDRWQVSAEGLRGILDEGGCPLCRLLEPAVGTLLAEGR